MNHRYSNEKFFEQHFDEASTLESQIEDTAQKEHYNDLNLRFFIAEC